MEQNRKLIFINQYTGYLFIDVVNAFAEDHPCELFAGQVIPANVPLNTSVRRRSLIKYSRNSGFRRIYTWGMFTLQTFFRLLFTSGSTELFIVTNPPFTPFVGYFFHKLRGTSYHLLVYDVYPDALVQFGKAKKKGWINRVWSRMNGHLYKNAASVFTLSNNMASLIKTYSPQTEVQVVPNWTDTSFIKPVAKQQNPFAKEQQQSDKITVMYSGNMGATHAVEKIAELAAALHNDPQFGFLLIGDGVKKAMIAKMKEEQQLDNLIILPFQKADVLPYSLTCADVGIVTLSSGAEDLSVPSKTYNLLAAGVVLLVISSPASELARMIEMYDCGAHFEEKETEKMVAFLRRLKANPDQLAQLKANARKASFNFTSANAYQYKLHLKRDVHVPEAVETC
jgi:glycosyltransferase involved in cell wall biosynthesis